MPPFATSVEIRRFPWGTAGIAAVCLGIEVMLTAFQLHGGDVGRVYGLLGSSPASPNPLTWISAPLIHTGFLPLVGNLVFLWVFAPPLEDRLGTPKFVLLWIGLAAGGFAVDTAFRAIGGNGGTPFVIGESAAVSGLIGAFLFRFPSARLRQAMVELPKELPIWIAMGLWFAARFWLWIRSGNDTIQSPVFGTDLALFGAGLTIGFVLWRDASDRPANLLQTIRSVRLRNRSARTSNTEETVESLPDDPALLLERAREILREVPPRADSAAAMQDGKSPLFRAARALLRAVEIHLQTNEDTEALGAAAERWEWVGDSDMPTPLLSRLALAAERAGEPALARSLLWMVLARADAGHGRSTAALRLAPMHVATGSFREAARAMAILRRTPGRESPGASGESTLRQAIALGIRRTRGVYRMPAAVRRAIRSSFEELPFVPACVLFPSAPGRDPSLEVLPVAGDPSAVDPGAALHQRIGEAGVVAAARAQTEAPGLRVPVRLFDGIDTESQASLLERPETRTLPMQPSAKRILEERRATLRRAEADRLWKDRRRRDLEQQRQNLEETTAAIRKDDWSSEHTTYFLLYGLPLFLGVEGILLVGTIKLAFPKHAGLAFDIGLALLLPANWLGFRFYRALVLAPTRIVDAVYKGSDTEPTTGLGYARALEQRGQYGEAASDYRRTLVAEPGRLDARLALAELYRFRMHDLDRAVAEYLILARTDPSPGGAAHALLEAATLQREQGNHAAARRALDELLRRFPQEPVAEGARRLLATLQDQP